MKKVLIINILIIITNYVYSQKNDSIQFIEFGLGIGNNLHSNEQKYNGALSIGVAKNINNYLINYLEYNMSFQSNEIYYHELSYKVGPYYRFWKESYFALAAGVSIIFNPNAYQTKVENEAFMYEAIHDQNDWLINIPIQARVNINLCKDLYLGLKGTYNTIFTRDVNDRYSVLIYLAIKIK